MKTSPSMTCREVIDFLMAYLDRELTDLQRTVFEQHLSVCPSCVNYLESYRTAVRLGKAAMHDPEQDAGAVVPEDLVRAVCAARDGEVRA